MIKHFSLLFVSLVIFAVIGHAQTDLKTIADSYKCFSIGFESEFGDGKVFADVRLAIRTVKNPLPIRIAAAELFSDTRATIKARIVREQYASKSEKFVRFAKLNASIFKNAPVFRIGNIYVLTFPMPENTRLKKGMNYLAFEYRDGKILWDVSFTDPVVSLLLSCDLKNAAPLEQKTLSPSDAKILDDIIKNSLPFITFSNGAFVSLEADSEVENMDASKFYHDAQKYFFGLKLDDYAKYYAPQSEKNFRADFCTMSVDNQKKALSQYQSWKKKYLKLMDGGKFKILIFSREKSGENTQTDSTLFEMKDGNYYICGFGANKTPLDMFLAKYLFSDGKYIDNMSQKYLRK